MLVGLFNAIGSVSVGSGVDVIHTSGYSAVGVGRAAYVPYTGSAHAAERANLRAIAIAGGQTAAAADAALASTENRSSANRCVRSPMEVGH